MEELIDAHGQNVLFSNFLITISTNVVPVDAAEHGALADWLRIQANDMFDDWTVLNGTVLKPANSPNEDKADFDDDHRIERVRSRVSLEAGDQRGQIHMHVLLEVAHMYREHTNAWGGRGVHVNVQAMRDYLNGQIWTMAIREGRKPQKIYVNSRLITSRDNPSAKWLTLAYINKQRDRPQNGQAPRDLTADRLAAPAEDQRIHASMRNPELEFTKRRQEVEFPAESADALAELAQNNNNDYHMEPQEPFDAPAAGGTAPNSPRESPRPVRVARVQRPRKPIGAEQSTSSYNEGDNLNPNIVWNPVRRRKARREKDQ